MQRVREPGHASARIEPFGADDATHVTRLTDVLTEHDEAMLRAFVEDEVALSYPRLRRHLGEQTRRGSVHPVFFGSAAHGIGVDALLGGIDELLAGKRGDPERLTQLVLMTALERAGTWVCEPLADLRLEVPASTAPGVTSALRQLKGRVTGQFSGGGLSTIGAVLPVEHVRALQHRLPGLSMGEGIMETRPGGYQPVGEHPPRRPRSNPSPLDRDAWLASLATHG